MVLSAARHRVPRRLSAGRRGALTIAAGTAVGQAVGLLAAPVLSRLFTPSDFGLLTIVTALSVSVASVAALRLELAVPLPESERDARSLVALGLLAAATTAVLGTALVAVAGDQLVRALGEPALQPWLWLVPLLSATIASFGLLNQLAVRHRRYGAVGRRNLVSSVATVSTQVGAGAAGLRPGALVLGLVVGQLLGAVSLLRGAGLRVVDPAGAQTVRSLRRVLRRHRRFALLLAPAGLLNVLGIQLPVLVMAYVYGSEVAGWLGMSQRVLALPVMLVGQAVAQVYLGELSREVRESGSSARLLFSRASRQLAVVALGLAVVLLAFGPALFRLVLGPEWTPSGDYARALAVGLAAQLVAAPLSQTLVVLGHAGQQLAWDAGRLLLTVGVVIACAALDRPATTAVWALGAALTGSYAAGWWLARRAIRAQDPARTPASARTTATAASPRP